MAFGLYKPGQGYWTRTMTAIGVGMMGLATAAWTWSELRVVSVPFEVIYLQAAVAGAIAVFSAFFTYWMVGRHARINEFFIATEGEMRKVAWPPRKEITGSTWVVIGVSVMIAVILFVSDVVFSRIFTWIGVLEGG